MCLALIAFDAHPRYTVVVAANRDEYHARPAAPAAWWDEGFLAGRDLKAGGTWLGVDTRGRFALLTNVREPSRHDPAAPSRGVLVPNVLTADASPSVSLPAQVRAGAAHNGFNLLAGDSGELLWGSNRAAVARWRSAPGDLRRFESSARHAVAQGGAHEAGVSALVRRRCGHRRSRPPSSRSCATRERAPDDALPATGVTLERERMLSSPFIVGADYGTRCSTVLTIDRRRQCALCRAHASIRPGPPTGEVEYRFAVTREGSTPSYASGRSR